jgi:hypothetical protein
MGICVPLAARYGDRRAGSFTGANGSINCGSAEALDNLGRIAPYGFTIGAWVKPNSAGQNNYGRIIDKSRIYLSCDPGGLVSIYSFFSTNTKYASGAIPFGVWSFVVGEYTGSNMLITVNNTIAIGNPVTGAVDDHSAINCLIGNNSGNNRCFDGTIGEVMAYNRALTPQEIKRIYLVTKWRYQ